MESTTVTNRSESTGSWNMASSTAGQRKEIEAHKAECLERYRQALELASRIYSQRREKGNGWRAWAERELAARPELEAEARAKLNRLMRDPAGQAD